ncbi:MAG: DUF3106 domain-containing protein [Planctomycetota bacterium]
MAKVLPARRLGRRRLLLAVAGLLAVFATPAVGQNEARDLERNRARWENMSEEERAVMRERFEKLRQMRPEEREALREVARGLRQLEDGLRKAPPRELEEWMRRHPHPGDREREVRRYLREHAGEFGGPLRERIPPEVRARLEGASPAERALLAREHFRARCGGRDRSGVDHALRGLARELDLPEEGVERFLSLPPDEQLAKVLELRRRLVRRAVEKNGLPPGLSAEEWRGMESLPDHEFFFRLRAFDSHLPGPFPRSGRPGGWGPRGEHGGRRDGPDRRDEPGRPAGGLPPPPPPPSERARPGGGE